jgi:beta-1,4-galactosyltransferase 1
MRIKLQTYKRKCFVYLKVPLTLIFSILILKNIISIVNFLLYDDLNGNINDKSINYELDSLQYNNFDLLYRKVDSKIASFNGDLCSFIPTKLNGRFKIELTNLTDNELDKKFENHLDKTSGGHWKPTKCKSRSKVAIIVPYRDRKSQLNAFLNHMHQFLPKQLVDYSIYIIEEAPNIIFNRAKLMNIGFKEALKDYEWDCVIFHDVDLLPEDDRNFYYCSEYPRHMSIAVNTLGYRLPYEEIFGGVSMILVSDFIKINGYSNLYFGWGGEDDDMFERLKYHGLPISRYSSEIGRYFMLSHKKDAPNNERSRLLDKAKERFTSDGLNSLTYNLLDKKFLRLFTLVKVSFNDQIE